MTTFRVLAFALLISLQAQAALHIGPATPVTSQAERVGAYHDQYSSSIAWNGETGMVIWLADVHARTLVLANHIDANGDPLEAAPLVISTERGTQFARVVPLGGRFLVVWETDNTDDAGTRVALVEPNGTIVHRGVVAASPFRPMDVASNGTTALITGSSGNSGFQSELLWIDADGSRFSRKSFGTKVMNQTLVRASGSSFLVVAERFPCENASDPNTCVGSQLVLVRAEANGTMNEPKVIRAVSEPNGSFHRLKGFAVTQDRFLAVVSESPKLTGVLFEHDGDMANGPFPIEEGFAGGLPVAVASDGNAFAVAYPYSDNDALPPVQNTRLRHVDGNGSADPETILQTQSIVALEWTGGGYVLTHMSAQTPDMTATRLSASGQFIADAPVHVLSRAPNQQESPDAAWDGSQLFTVWEEFQPDERVWKVKFGTGREISESAASQRNARVLFDGIRHVVLWAETTAGTTEIRARRVNRDGSFAGNAFLVTAVPACAPGFNAALVDGRVLVVHTVGNCGSFEARMVATPINTDNTVSTSIVVADSSSEGTPVLASSGSTALIVWSQNVGHVADDPCIGEDCPPRFVLAGAVIEGSSVKRVVLSQALLVNHDPEIAWNGAHYLIAWVAETLQTRLFSADGTPASSLSVLAEEARPSFPHERNGTVTATANGFLVAWRRGLFMNSLSVWRVARDGTPVDVVEHEIEHEAIDLRTPRLVRGADGSSYLLYSLSGPNETYNGHSQIVSRPIVEAIRRRATRH